ncbi:hypothetical protein CLOM_g9171 [Closterium sp. NIES-68]|nr:hypothetical protein CLOM_g4191 [Closterium sp. NIES-68]GJP50015.1 hypothetical protein CLOM_g9171 [Closterium sp. NIES-68]GJP77573.1 hypothetical protein CLOP_g7943 [Closterium sp. NIES-67]
MAEEHRRGAMEDLAADIPLPHASSAHAAIPRVPFPESASLGGGGATPSGRRGFSSNLPRRLPSRPLSITLRTPSLPDFTKVNLAGGCHSSGNNGGVDSPSCRPSPSNPFSPPLSAASSATASPDVFCGSSASPFSASPCSASAAVMYSPGPVSAPSASTHSAWRSGAQEEAEGSRLRRSRSSGAGAIAAAAGGASVWADRGGSSGRQPRRVKNLPCGSEPPPLQRTEVVIVRRGERNRAAAEYGTVPALVASPKYGTAPPPSPRGTVGGPPTGAQGGIFRSASCDGNNHSCNDHATTAAANSSCASTSSAGATDCGSLKPLPGWPPVASPCAAGRLGAAAGGEDVPRRAHSAAALSSRQGGKPASFPRSRSSNSVRSVPPNAAAADTAGPTAAAAAAAVAAKGRLARRQSSSDELSSTSCRRELERLSATWLVQPTPSVAESCASASLGASRSATAEAFSDSSDSDDEFVQLYGVAAKQRAAAAAAVAVASAAGALGPRASIISGRGSRALLASSGPGPFSGRGKAPQAADGRAGGERQFSDEFPIRSVPEHAAVTGDDGRADAADGTRAGGLRREGARSAELQLEGAGEGAGPSVGAGGAGGGGGAGNSPRLAGGECSSWGMLPLPMPMPRSPSSPCLRELRARADGAASSPFTAPIASPQVKSQGLLQLQQKQQQQTQTQQTQQQQTQQQQTHQPIKQQQHVSPSRKAMLRGEGAVHRSSTGRVKSEAEVKRGGERHLSPEQAQGEYVRQWWLQQQQQEQQLQQQQQQLQEKKMTEAPPMPPSVQQQQRMQAMGQTQRRRRNMSNDELQAQVESLEAQLKQLQTEHLLQQEQAKQQEQMPQDAQQRRLSQQRQPEHKEEGGGNGKGEWHVHAHKGEEEEEGGGEGEEEEMEEGEQQRLQVRQQHQKEWQRMELMVQKEQVQRQEEAWQEEHQERVMARRAPQSPICLSLQRRHEVRSFKTQQQQHRSQVEKAGDRAIVASPNAQEHFDARVLRTTSLDTAGIKKYAKIHNSWGTEFCLRSLSPPGMTEYFVPKSPTPGQKKVTHRRRVSFSSTIDFISEDCPP